MKTLFVELFVNGSISWLLQLVRLLLAIMAVIGIVALAYYIFCFKTSYGFQKWLRNDVDSQVLFGWGVFFIMIVFLWKVFKWIAGIM